MAAINLASLSAIEKTSYVREGLEIAKPNLIFQQFGQGDRVAKRDGKTRQWFRFTKNTLRSGTDADFTDIDYVKNTTGASPNWTPKTPGTTTLTAQVDFLFGQGHQWNEGIQYTSLADLPKELRIINAQHAAEAIETEVIAVLKAGTNAYFANGKASRGLLAPADKVDMDDFIDAVTVLRRNDARTIQGMYRALVSPEVIAQLQKDDDFKNAVVYQKDYAFTGTIAELFGTGFAWSSMAPAVEDAGSNNAVADVEQSLIVGDNSYGITKWMMDDYDLVYTPPGGHGDEWANKHSLAWKFMFKSLILNQDWMVRLESAR